MRWLNLADEDRLLLPFAKWPETARAEWDRAFGKRPRPRRDSEGGRLPRPRTIDKLRKACCTFYGFLRRADRLPAGARLLDLATEDNLDAYFQALLARDCAGHTIVSYFSDLRQALQRLYPGQPFKYVTCPDGIGLRHRLDMTKRKDEPPLLDELIAWTKELYAAGLVRTGSQRRRVQVRDAVMMALLCIKAPRLLSLSEMRKDVHLQQRGDEWWLAFEPDDDKTKQALRAPLDPWIWPMLRRYLDVERGELLKKGNKKHDTLWVGWDGEPLDEGGVEKRIRWWSEKRFGKSFGPHTFRDAIATDDAEKGTGGPFAGATRLAHADPNTTVAYTHPRALAGVARRHAQALREARRELEELARKSYGDIE